ncbi:hypothetical protein ACPCHT_28645 [Nucisporomicrobium flavum]|uniref:hypothetical protein n=1 Tax=Nucisporomicrobium flavum TaxID=2785915 RepID=UPI0018F6B960|nr:hypothetical protein [Nucisporomicrobium flavum]
MQLHEIVDAVTADEPPLAHRVDDIIAAGRRAERRRRAGFASAGAAGLVAVAVGGVFALSPGGSPAPDGTRTGTVGAASKGTKAAATWGASEPFTFTFQGYDAGKFQVQDPIVASTAYQIASVYEKGRTTNDRPSTEDATGGLEEKKRGGGDPTLYAYLTLYRPGAFDPSGIKGGKAVTVAGHKAVQSSLPVGLDPKNAIDPANKQLAWEYTDDAWAVVTSISSDEADPSFADLGELAAGLKPSTPRPATVPFTVGYTPAGFEPVQTGTHALPGLDGIASAREGDYGGATFAKPAPATTGLTEPFDTGENGVKGSFQIFVTPSRNSNQKAQAGKTKCYANGFCNVWSADGKVQVQVSDEGTGADLPEAELKKIAQSVKVADVTDAGSWTPAAKALRP